MSDNNELLAGLGLDLNAAGTDAVAADDAATTEATEKVKRTKIEVGVIEFGEEEDIPVLTRTFTGERNTGSKYKFDEIVAPVAKEDGTFKYIPMIVAVGDNEPEAFKRSIQSATTAANNKYKTGEGDAAVYERKFITRSFNDAAGKFAGMKVYRVDGTLAAE